MVIMDIMDIMNIMNIKNFMNITAWMAMAGTVSALVLVLVGFQAVKRGENKLPHDYYTLDPQFFTDSEPPIND